MEGPHLAEPAGIGGWHYRVAVHPPGRLVVPLLVLAALSYHHLFMFIFPDIDKDVHPGLDRWSIDAPSAKGAPQAS